MGSGASSQAPSGALLPKATSRSREWCPDTQQKELYHAAEYAALEQLLRGLRSERVRKEFAKVPEEEYTQTEEFRIWVGTYNVNGRKLEKGATLSQLLTTWDSNWPPKTCDGGEGEECDRADIYVMGFQEVVPLNAQNIAGVWSTANAASWDAAIDQSLNPWKGSEDNMDNESSESKEGSENGDVNVIDLLSAWSGTLNEKRKPTRKKDSHPDAGRRTAWKVSEDSAVEGSSGQGSGIINETDNPSNESEAKGPISYPLGKNDTFHYDDGYVQIVSRQLCGVYLSIWVRRCLVPKITGVQTTYVATGALGYLANKGAIAARMRINDSSLVVVTSHFASGDHVGDEVKRNLDFSEIMRRAEFSHERNIGVDGDLEGVPHGARSDVKRAYLGGSWGASRKLHNHENIIWLGDLNYRIQSNNPAVVQTVRASRLDRLYALDELQREMTAGRVFNGFKEAPIIFAPTYKYNRGTNYYTGEHGGDDTSSSDSDDEPQVSKSGSTTEKSDGDALGMTPFQQTERSRGVDGELGQNSGMSVESTKDVSSDKGSTSSSFVNKPKKKTKKPKKIRTPSWTDRILYYTNGRLHHLLYGSCMDMMMSDHKPVCSAFLLQSKLVNREVAEQHLEKCRRVADEREMANIPRCKVEPNQIDFGSVKYKERHTSSLFVVNTGEVSAMFGFIPPPDPAFAQHASPLPHWISAKPVAGEVAPGEKVEISLTIHVTGGMWGDANELAASPDGQLDEVLVIRVEGGSDCFIQISGAYLPSAFGLSLERLAGIKPKKDPSRTLQSHKVDLASMRYRSQSDPLELMEYHSDNIDEPGSTELPAQSAFAPLTRTGPRPNIVEGPIGEMIPSQLSKMLHFLCKNDRLSTPNVFVDGMKGLLKAEKRNRDDEEVAIIRKIVDNEDCIPSTIGGKQMGKALLSFFIDLPTPLIPVSVAKTVSQSKLSKELAASLTQEAMTAVEWGVMRTTLEVFRTALTPEHAAVNNLTISSLASVLADVWFRSKELEPGVVYTEEEKISIGIAKAQQKQRQAKYMEFFLQLPGAEE